MLRAGIDIGTNTILLLVAEVTGKGVTVKEDHLTVVRLGQGVDKNKKFHPEALARADACFAHYQKILAQYPGIDIRAIATSGSRDASDSPTYFASVKERFGIEVQVVSGPLEAKLSFYGALSGLEDDPKTIAVLDIGGGSTEIVALDQGELVRHSFDLGCVRMTERFLSDPATPEELKKLRDYIRDTIDQKNALLQRVRDKKLVGVAGTATYLASIHLGLSKFDPLKVDGARVTREELKGLEERLCALTAKEKIGLGGMDQGRADVIASGAIILGAVMDASGMKSYQASVRGLRFGAVLDLPTVGS